MANFIIYHDHLMKLISSPCLLFVCTIIILIVSLSSCRTTYQTQAFRTEDIPPTPDYTKPEAWAVLPSKYSAEFQKYASQQVDTLPVDVFYIYPTLNGSKKDIRWNVPIDDAEQNETVLNKAVLMQASAFATVGKVYVPFYRQAHLRSYRLYEEGGKEAQELAYTDVKSAFEVYLKKYNNNRPIIIVGHSQGTTHTSRLLKEFFDGKPLQKRLIAAYIPGIRLKVSYFDQLKPMNHPKATGGFVAWNTYKKGHYPKRDKDWYKGSVTTNPITWDTTSTTTLAQHKGFLYSNEKLYNQALKVEIIDGLVWSTVPKFPLRLFMSFLKRYHAGDINLFWQDIRENALLRTRVWLEAQQN